MWIQNGNNLVLPCGDDTIYTTIEEKEMVWENSTLEIDGTGRLQITNSGGTSSAEGGMGSGNQDAKEKGELNHPVSGEKGGKPNVDPNSGFDPIKENIDKATAERHKDNE